MWDVIDYSQSCRASKLERVNFFFKKTLGLSWVLRRSKLKKVAKINVSVTVRHQRFGQITKENVNFKKSKQMKKS